MAKRFLGYSERSIAGEVYVKVVYQENSAMNREEFKLDNATAQQAATRSLFFTQGVDPTLQNEIAAARRGTQK
jgi:hypothetical protein